MEEVNVLHGRDLKQISHNRTRICLFSGMLPDWLQREDHYYCHFFHCSILTESLIVMLAFR